MLVKQKKTVCAETSFKVNGRGKSVYLRRLCLADGENLMSVWRGSPLVSSYRELFLDHTLYNGKQIALLASAGGRGSVAQRRRRAIGCDIDAMDTACVGNRGTSFA